MYQVNKPVHADYGSIMGRVRGGDESGHSLNTVGRRVVIGSKGNNPLGPKHRIQVVAPGAQTGVQKTPGAPYPDNVQGGGIFGRHDIKVR